MPAVYEVDGSTGLPMFMLAAIGQTSDIESVFNLLKECPSSIGLMNHRLQKSEDVRDSLLDRGHRLFHDNYIQDVIRSIIKRGYRLVQDNYIQDVMHSFIKRGHEFLQDRKASKIQLDILERNRELIQDLFFSCVLICLLVPSCPW